MKVYRNGFFVGIKPSRIKDTFIYNGRIYQIACSIDCGDSMFYWWYIRKYERGWWRNFDIRELWRELDFKPIDEWPNLIIEAERNGDRLAVCFVKNHLLQIGIEPIFTAKIVKNTSKNISKPDSFLPETEEKTDILF